MLFCPGTLLQIKFHDDTYLPPRRRRERRLMLQPYEAWTFSRNMNNVQCARAGVFIEETCAGDNVLVLAAAIVEPDLFELTQYHVLLLTERGQVFNVFSTLDLHVHFSVVFEPKPW